jgi:hypothetical protein
MHALQHCPTLPHSILKSCVAAQAHVTGTQQCSVCCGAGQLFDGMHDAPYRVQAPLVERTAEMKDIKVRRIASRNMAAGRRS